MKLTAVLEELIHTNEDILISSALSSCYLKAQYYLFPIQLGNLESAHLKEPAKKNLP